MDLQSVRNDEFQSEWTCDENSQIDQNENWTECDFVQQRINEQG